MDNIKSVNFAVRYVGLKIIRWLCDFGKTMCSVLRLLMILLSIIAFPVLGFEIWYYKCIYNSTLRIIFIVFIGADAYLWVRPFIMICRNSKKLSKYLIETNIVKSQKDNIKEFSAFLNKIKKDMTYNGIFWNIKIPVEKKNEEMRQRIYEYVAKNFVNELDFSSYIESKEYIEKLMDGADCKLFTDRLVKKPDDQEYFCFDNSFLEYVDAFSPVLKKHHELYGLEKNMGENENEKRSE